LPTVIQHLRTTLTVAATCCTLAAPVAATAQAAPDKALRVMVGASLGGGTDILARMLADKFALSLKQSVRRSGRAGLGPAHRR
jgi:tripartite-type tricarboxylate transporter receptor subunit TctC